MKRRRAVTLQWAEHNALLGYEVDGALYSSVLTVPRAHRAEAAQLVTDAIDARFKFRVRIPAYLREELAHAGRIRRPARERAAA
jgi:hypothetical protein